MAPRFHSEARPMRLFDADPGGAPRAVPSNRGSNIPWTPIS